MITLLAVTDSDKHFSDAIAEYTKRLGGWLQCIALKPHKDKNADICITKDTELVIQTLQKKQYTDVVKVMCSIDGQELSSHDFSSWMWKGSVVFVIWWPYGLDESKLKNLVDKKISFGRMTMPHGLVKLVLLEQIYRADTIKTGKKYHY